MLQFENSINDTIVAISTPLAPGPIGIIRISGKNAISILERIFIPNNNKLKVADAKTHTLHLGRLINPANNNIIDTVLVSIMRAPNSYTGEDMVEINCHGSLVILNEIIDVIVNQKQARLAEKGEFTKRAFLNKKIDLLQAEAINDLICAKTSISKDIALNQFLGRFSEWIWETKNYLIELLALIEVSIDYPDEDIETIEFEPIKNKINAIIVKINKIIATSKQGRIIKNGVNAVITGRVNVGKSLLFNRLLNKDRVIVSAIPGTTRDFVQEKCEISGILFNLTDTAGFKTPVDIIEQEALAKTKQMILDSDLILAVFDGSNRLHPEDFELLNFLNTLEKNIIFILNKNDLPEEIEVNYFNEFIRTSALKKIGIDELKQRMYKTFWTNGFDYKNEIVLTNLRYEIALHNTINFLKQACKAIDEKLSVEFIAYDLRKAVDSLSEITGEITNEDILEKIFNTFCIGK